MSTWCAAYIMPGFCVFAIQALEALAAVVGAVLLIVALIWIVKELIDDHHADWRKL